MNFYISKIKLWFRNETEPRTLEFYNDKVNVITGASSTGKSSILKIIDYCLLQDRCNIVQDVINSSVSWYGMLFYKDDKPYTIIRKAPMREMPEMVTIFRENEYLPDNTPQADDNDQRSKVLPKFNELFNVPIKMKLDSKIKLNFRHYLLFNYLTEDIIATENTYQDVRFFRNREFDRILDDIFKITIGVNEAAIRELESQMEKAKRDTANKKRVQQIEFDKVEAYKKKRENIMQELVNLDLYDASDLVGTPDEWIQIMNAVVENYKIQFRDVRKENKRRELEEELGKLHESYGYFTSLEKECKIYTSRLTKQKDSLEPIEFIENHMPEVFHYYETSLLMGKLKEAWTNLRENYTPEVKLPDNFEKRKHDLYKEIESKTAELNRLNPMQPERQSMQWIRSVILLAEMIEKELKVVPTIKIKEENIIQLTEKETIINEYLTRLKARNENALGDLNDHIKKYFKYQDGLSDSYSDCTPSYSMDQHTLMLDRQGWEYPIANVGSKSNYMFLHLCYFFGLHDLLKSNENEQVLPFLFIDQPSIPYYADRKDDTETLEGDDESKLLSAFKLIDKFMNEMTNGNGHFQIIMIEHASTRYWEENNKLETFATRGQFSKINGLIPNKAIIK